MKLHGLTITTENLCTNHHVLMKVITYQIFYLTTEKMRTTTSTSNFLCTYDALV